MLIVPFLGCLRCPPAARLAKRAEVESWPPRRPLVVCLWAVLEGRPRVGIVARHYPGSAAASETVQLLDRSHCVDHRSEESGQCLLLPMIDGVGRVDGEQYRTRVRQR